MGERDGVGVLLISAEELREKLHGWGGTPGEAMVAILLEIRDAQRETRDACRFLVARVPVPPLPPASAEELDAKGGDPELKIQPTKEPTTIKGRKFSTLTADQLGRLAHMFDYFATSNDAKLATDNKGSPKSLWDRRSAALARGWRARKLSGWKAPGEEGLDDLPAEAPPTPGLDDLPDQEPPREPGDDLDSL